MRGVGASAESSWQSERAPSGAEAGSNRSSRAGSLRARMLRPRSRQHPRDWRDRGQKQRVFASVADEGLKVLLAAHPFLQGPSHPPCEVPEGSQGLVGTKSAVLQPTIPTPQGQSRDSGECTSSGECNHSYHPLHPVEALEPGRCADAFRSQKQRGN